MASIQALTSQLPSTTTILDLTTSSSEKLHHISSLSRFTNLKVLNLSNHMLLKIENIPRTFNQIQVLENIDHLVLLQELYLSSNIIKKLESLESNKNLRILELAHNELEVESLGMLATCRELSILTLEGNPLIEQVSYKTIVGIFMKSLIMLDKQPLKKEVVLPDDPTFKNILKESLEEKETILKEAYRLKERESDPEKIIETKINKLKLQNLKIIEQIIRQQEKAEELGEEYLKSKHSIQQTELLQLIQNKYQESLRLEEQLKELEGIPNPTIQEQKARNALLEKLITNEENLEYYQRELEQLRASNELQTIKSQISQQSINIYSELNVIHAKILALRKKLKSNQNLLIQYSNNLDSNFRTHQQSHFVQMLTKLVFGEARQISSEMLSKLCEKYNQGLLNVLGDLAGIMFGNEPSIEKIRKLKESLNGRALLDWFCQKNRSRKREKKFLQQKENFILEFEKQTQDLAENWLQLKKAEDKFYRKMRQYQKRQVRQQEQMRQKLKEMMDEHHLAIKVELQEHKSILNSAQLQLAALESQKQTLENQIVQLKQQKHILSGTKAELEKVKHQIRKKKLELQSIQETSQSTIFHNQSIEKKSYLISEKYNQRYSELLNVQSEYKVLKSKLALLEVEYSETKNELQESGQQLLELRRLVIEEQKALERTKTGVAVLEDKLQNLNKLALSKKMMLQSFEKQLGKQSELSKKRSSPSVISDQQLLIQNSILKKKHSDI